MSGIDYKGIFARVLYEELGETFMRHGIDTIYEDELEDIVAECTYKVYWPSVAEFRRAMGMSVMPRRGEWRPSPPRVGLPPERRAN